MVTDRSLTGSLTALLYYRFQVLCSHVGGNTTIIVLEHLFCQQAKKECPWCGTEKDASTKRAGIKIIIAIINSMQQYQTFSLQDNNHIPIQREVV